MQTATASSKSMRWAIAAILALVLAAWIATPYVISYFIPVGDSMNFQSAMAVRGQAGDIYGSVNALFSGFAFVGVVVAIVLQSQELRLQREELAANRTELARTADAQSRTQEAL